MPPASSNVELLSKFAIPVSIVIAGALIAIALFYGGGTAAPSDPNQAAVLEEIRTVQDNDHLLGNKDAKIVIVEYSDTECPFCKQFHETLHRIYDEYGANGDVAWVYRHFPLEQLHPKAPKEAEALECAAEQGGNDTFWKFTDMVYQTTGSNNALDIGVHNTPDSIPVGQDGKPWYTEKTPKSATDAGQLSDFARTLGLNVAQFEECLATGKYAERVMTDYEEAAAAGGTGTPHSILIVDGKQIPIEGAQPYINVKQLIDSLL